MEKHFDQWNDLKKHLDTTQKMPTFKQKEIWWCSIGLNIGHEENGKNQFFNRPVLVVRKFNNNIFLGVPLTTKIKDDEFYHMIHFKDKNQSAMLSQIRVLESKRLTQKMGDITKEQFEDVRRKIKEMI